uniref:ATP synthase subunit a n=1 Tax=Eubranchipus grubii TaxID=381661 RepID=A0A7D7J1F4_9CRUS|nr:ATP synthase F0 subunit 6 [Eubranchipus grubii]QMP96532.1 ATP synthase F0 subunit 6 [Eubranchipus grubii]
MMSNLFSVFDPTSSLLTNWLSIMLVFIMLPWTFWVMPTRTQVMWYSTTMKLNKEFSLLLGPNKSGSPLLLVSLFSFILFNNLLGMFPYLFTATSHLAVTLALALPLWLSFLLRSWIQESKHALAHLVPLGTPPILMPFMVIIELVSNFIRPITLSVRLAANMIAGHLLLTLLGNQAVDSTILPIIIVLSSQILLLMLEFSVAMIQAYVFTTLTTLYAGE